jgi:class 3 adenylate cyclase
VVSSSQVDRREVAVLFADLAGYTALTEAHGDEEAARAAMRLLELAHDAYDGCALVVKSLGDGVMLAFDSATVALAAALALSHAARVEDRFPGLRVGLQAGPAVLRAGDVFGATVNEASRIAEEAAPGQVLVARGVMDGLDDLGVEVIELGPTQLRHVRDPVELVAVRDHAGGSAGVPVDPVCRMQVDEDTAEAVVRRHDGQLVRFCSSSCARLFADHPDAYV